MWTTLYDTYQNNYEASQDTTNPMLPICHTKRGGHYVEILLDVDGNFLEAKALPKGSSVRIPCTERSDARGSGDDPHPLADNLKNLGSATHLALLKGWLDASGLPKLNAVHSYLTKGTIREDLKIFSPPPEYVCWSVEIPGVLKTSTWDDPEIAKSWIEYYLSIKKSRGFCMITGEDNVPLVEVHPRFLLGTSDMTKLVSSNDPKGFTYLGKFGSADQACTMGFEAAQKAYRAFSWVFVTCGWTTQEKDLGFVAWEPEGRKIPNFMDALPDEFEVTNMNYSQEYGLLVKRFIQGYTVKLGPNTDVFILGTDAPLAGKGCRTITLFQKLHLSEFLANLENWHTKYAWTFNKTQHDTETKKVIKRYVAVEAPTPWRIAKTLSGDKKNLLKRNLARLIPCILESKPLPVDLIKQACRDAIKRWTSYKKDYERDAALNFACALYRGYYNHYHPTEEITMALDPNRCTRDYLYGRLLAVADNFERTVLKRAGSMRDTNASRYEQKFANSPLTTWRIIEGRIKPHVTRGRSHPYTNAIVARMESLVNEIIEKFQTDDFLSNAPLSGEYLLGRRLQMMKFEEEARQGKLDKEAREAKKAEKAEMLNLKDIPLDEVEVEQELEVDEFV